MEDKMSERMPKVLVVAINAWQDQGANHTLSEIFSCWDKSKVSQIYVRGGLPSTAVCDRFLRISENDIIRSVVKRNTKTASVVENCFGELSEAQQKELELERKRYSKRKKNNSSVKSLCREVIWFLSKWKSKELLDFIKESDPDVIFLPMVPVVYMPRIQYYIVRTLKKPTVFYILDDCYSYRNMKKSPLTFLQRFWGRIYIKKIMKHTDRIFTMTPKASETFEKIFSVKASILTKAVDYSNLEFCPESPREPLTMVYTGRLYFGREDALANIAKAVHSINRDGERLRLHIYAPEKVSDGALLRELHHSVKYMGEVTRNEVKRIQQESDIAIFAESLHKKYRFAAGMSFSTKLTDYFASGRCIFAVGDKDIAPIDYLMREDAACVVTDYKDIEATLRRLCDNPELITEYGRKAFECGKRNHSDTGVYPAFIKEMKEIAGEY